SILVGLSDVELDTWHKGYDSDPFFGSVIRSLRDTVHPQNPQYSHYFCGDNGLLYFEDWHGNNRLCVPEPLRLSVMEEIHNSFTESAHGG
ncbi:hypothetical protein BT96DRAFT_749668, partial [Gymnopus androsaceus JB14]